MDWSQPHAVLWRGLDGPVLAALWNRTTPATGLEVRRMVGAGSTTGVREALQRHVASGLVTSTPAGRSVLYRLNRDHVAYPALDAALQAFDPKALLRRRMVDLVRARLGKGPDVTLALFGSVARGESGPDSDIDLLLVVPDDADREAVMQLTDEMRDRGRMWTGNRIQVYEVTRSGLAELRDAGAPLAESWRADATLWLGTDAGLLIGAAG